MATDTHVPPILTPIIQASIDGFPQQTFVPNDISILASPNGLLNNNCINGCAALLYSTFLPTAARCAVLSTHDLPQIRYKANNDLLWRSASWMQFWDKPIWVLLIHCSLPIGPWILCTISFPSRQLFLFNSLAEQQPWQNDIKVSRLSTLAIH